MLSNNKKKLLAACTALTVFFGLSQAPQAHADENLIGAVALSTVGTIGSSMITLTLVPFAAIIGIYNALRTYANLNLPALPGSS